MDYKQACRQKDRLVLDIEELADEVHSVITQDELKEAARVLNAINIDWYE